MNTWCGIQLDDYMEDWKAKDFLKEDKLLETIALHSPSTFLN